VEGLEADVLLESTAGSWLSTTGNIEPDFRLFPTSGFAPSGEVGPRVLGVSASGVFKSYFAERPSPLFEGTGDEAQDGAADRTGRTTKESLPDARLTVLGSAEMVSDLMLQLSEQPGGEVHRSNLQLLLNLVDWSVEDTDLLAIRTSGAFARTLVPLSEDQARSWELGIYAVTALLLLGVTTVPGRQRRRTRAHAKPAGARGTAQ
jgi:ABC-2 type transport system permease protein